MITTLNAIRAHSPCATSWRTLLSHLGKTEADDEPLPLLTVLESNGFDDCLWCFRAVDGFDRDFRMFAVWCIRTVQHLFSDSDSLYAIDVAQAHALGLASNDELDAARDAAWAAWDAAWAAARPKQTEVLRDMLTKGYFDADLWLLPYTMGSLV